MIKRYSTSIPGIPLSKAVRAGDTVYLSGQIPMGPDGNLVEGGIVPQTRQTMDNVVAVLAEAGLTLADVVKTTIWLDDTRDFPAFNKVYAEYFGDTLPARSCIRADMMSDIKVEIEAIAYSPIGS
ncbi:MAG: RidA family protein [Henriciella sp.]|nr:RidA family protein [Henriciella sp.]